MQTPHDKSNLIHGVPQIRLVRFLPVIALVLLLALSAKATTYYVTVNDFGFSPATLTIEVGDTVVWENADDLFSHSTTSTLSFSNPNYWNGLLVNLGDTFGQTFNNVGGFNYFDQLGSGTGTITVILPVPPLISLGAPRQVGSQFLFDASGLTAGKYNVLQASTNLTSWVSIATNVADTTSMTFTNSTALPRRFFRVLELP